MRSLILAAVLSFSTVGVGVGTASAATCRDGGTRCVRSQLVIFGDDQYEGIRKTPAGSRFESDERAVFGRLLVLKKDLVFHIFATRKNRVLK